ncbi:glycosyltransferase family 4 protein [Nocardia shimofusensis]|uniref:glycosyltransferase family 4 protein n=1 Tax=Nocardia shimofusensis TaxID=228596 RepID=UPI00082BAE95|nr:glycosyltransferase family 4 protein [Nocardia shimofusensis]
MTRAVFLSHTAAPSGAELATLRLLSALERNTKRTGERHVAASAGAAVGGGAVEEAAPVRASMLLTEHGPLVELLRARGIPVTVCGNDFDSRSLTIAGSGPLRLIGGAFELIRLGRRLGEYVRAENADVLVAQSTKALLMGAVAARRARVPLVWQVHDRIASEYFGTVLAVLLRTLGWIVARGVVANSHATLATLWTRGRVAAVAYPGVEDTATGERAPQRAPADTRIVLVARLTPWKGHHILLRALPLLRRPPAAVTLVGGTFFGEEDYRRELERAAAELTVPVAFTGHVDDPGPYLRAADIAVHCSVTAEPFGQVVVEAMRAGCAVVATDAGGPTEIVRHDIDGLLVAPGDPAALAAAVDRLVADPALRTRLADAGARRCRDFSIEETARVVTALLHAVTGNEVGAR